MAEVNPAGALHIASPANDKPTAPVPEIPDLKALRARAIEQIDAILPSPTQKRTYSYAELFTKKDEEQRFIVPDLLPAEAVAVFIGEDGIGKTQICTQLCLSIAFRYDRFLGLPLRWQHARALIVATEDSRQKWIKACAKQSMRMEPRHRPEDVQIDFTEGSDFDDFLALKDEMEMLLGKNFYDLIVVDAFSDLFTLIDGEINSNSHARKLLSFFQHLCNTYGCTIIIIHHAAKSKIVVKQKEGKLFVEKGDSQGAGAITQKPRTVLALSNDPKSTHSDGSCYTNYLHVVKANLMGKQYMQNALKLRFDAASLIHEPQGLVDIHMMQEETEAPAQGEGGFAKKKPEPKDIPDADHHTILQQVFRDTDHLTRKDLVFRMGAQYGVGNTKVNSALEKGGFIAYLQHRGWLTPTSYGFQYTPAGAQLTAIAVEPMPDDEEPPF